MSDTQNRQPIPQRLTAIHAALDLLRGSFDEAALQARAEELEAQMQAPGFWDDQQTAAKVSAEHARATRRLEAWRALVAEVDDLDALAELAEEDPSVAGEVEETLSTVETRLAELEEARLFSGRYDAGDALVTVNAGAGGTDAQDWAEMVLRMLMRWAEQRGFQVEMLEASPGEEAGIKSATFRASGENAYGLFNAEKGVHRLVRLSPFDAANRRQTSFAGVEVAPVVDEIGDIEINDDDLQVDTYRASGAGGQHVNKTDSAVRITHRPSGIVVQCQNERSQSANRDTAMKMLRAKLLELEERKRREEIAKEKGDAQDVNFGSQIRSYVLHPYTMVKDHRTNHEVGNAQGVLDGDLDGFVRAELLRSAGARVAPWGAPGGRIGRAERSLQRSGNAPVVGSRHEGTHLRWARSAVVGVDRRPRHQRADGRHRQGGRDDDLRHGPAHPQGGRAGGDRGPRPRPRGGRDGGRDGRRGQQPEEGRPRARARDHLVRPLRALQARDGRPLRGGRRDRLDLRPPHRRRAVRVRARPVRRDLGPRRARGRRPTSRSCSSPTSCRRASRSACRTAASARATRSRSSAPGLSASRRS